VACSAPSKGALILAVSTDMRTPKDINVVSLLITSNGVPKFDYLGRVLPDGSVALPATLAIVEPDEPNAQIRIRVTAFQDANARVLRDVLTTVPHQTTSLLRLPLSFLDDGSGTGTIPAALVPTPNGTPDGDTTFDPIDPVTGIKSSCDFTLFQTSINGTCADARIASSTLPVYTQEAVYGTGSILANGAPSSCFDAGTCFAGAVQVTGLVMQGCSAPVPQGLDAASLNVALVTASTGECLAPGQCYVPLESDASTGFTVSGGMIHMVDGVCAKVQAGARLFAASSACPSKVPSNPLCEPTTAAAADAGAAGCDGSYTLTCTGTGMCGGGTVPVTVTGTSATFDIPMSMGNGQTTVTPATATVDPMTCVATLTIPADDASTCDASATVTFDLANLAPASVPCSSTGSDGTCSKSMLTCTIARGSSTAGGPDASVGSDAGTVGGNTVNGSASGVSLTARDSAAATGFITRTGEGVDGQTQNAVLAVLISDTPGVCSVQEEAIAGADQKASTTQLALVVERQGSTPIGAGTYGINDVTTSMTSLGPNQTWDFASITQTTPSCGFEPSTFTGTIPDSQAVSGSIVLSQVTNTSISGSFTLNFNGGVLSGTFDAPACSGVPIQSLFTTDGATLGQGGPDANGICYGTWGDTSSLTDAGLLPDAGPPPEDSGAPPSDAFAGGDAIAVGEAGTSACVLVPPGAISWWRGEGNGYDVYGNNPATWQGVQQYAAGEVGEAFQFLGSSFLSAAVNNINVGTGGTVEGWVRVDSMPATSVDLFGFGSSTMAMDVGGWTATGVPGEWQPDFTLAGQTVDTVASNIGQWVHLGVVWTAPSDAGVEQVQVYVNGSLYQSMPFSIADAGVPTAFLFGGEGSASFNLEGAVDEVTVYSLQLASAQISAIYGAGSAGKCQCMTSADCAGAAPCNLGFCGALP
jgi:hypothetical protein